MLPLAVTMGEPAGIGGELLLACWQDRLATQLPAFFVIDDVERLRALAGRIGLETPVARIAAPEQAEAVFASALPVLHRPLAVKVAPGRPDPANTPAVLRAIVDAVELTREGRAAAIVTNPINKAVLSAGGFSYPGHTEFLAALAGDPPVAMMLASTALRVVPVTIHLSLRAALDQLTTDRIVAVGRLLADALAQDFGLPHPRLAVAGINPHAGESGTMGAEDVTIVAPAVAALRQQGIDAIGPLSPDTMFHPEARARYDAALCMYHDQALIPLKTIDFFGGVNITLGLPFIRTSPDHGTAFDLAGSGRGRPDSLLAALRMAAAMALHRG